MRLVAALLTLCALAVAGFAGQVLWQELSAPPAAPAPAQVVASVAQTSEPQPPAPPRSWPALFGVPEPPKPPTAPEPQPPAPVAEPQPPKPPMPPLDSLGYRLKGMVRTGDAVWAMISHPTGERVLRPGDELEPGLTVVRIDAQGIQVRDAHGSEGRLAFEN